MYPPHHSSQPQISHSSIPPSQQYQSHQTSYVPQIAYTSPRPSTQPLTEFPQLDLDEEELAFLADPGIPNSQAIQTTIPNTVAFQTEDRDAYDSAYDDVSNAKSILMANLSNYGSDVLLEVPHSATSYNDMGNQSVHAMQDFKQTLIVDFLDNEITGDRNIIPYARYLQEPQLAAIQDTNFESCVKCLNLDAELLDKQNKYNDLSKRYSQLEKHCISLELTMLKKAQEKDKIGSKPDKNEKRAARRWLEKEPPRLITTWDDLVSKFINEFFPPSRTTNLRNEIANFQQKFDESFHEAWE
nr:reverse transcriptase domain-containing protein [Tanacetum cinerariifolium]